MNSGKCVGVSVSHMVVLFLSRYPLLRPSLLKDPFEHGFTNRDYVWLCELGHSFHFTPSWVNSCSSFISWNIALRILESLSHRRCAVDHSRQTSTLTIISYKTNVKLWTLLLLHSIEPKKKSCHVSQLPVWVSEDKPQKPVTQSAHLAQRGSSETTAHFCSRLQQLLWNPEKEVPQHVTTLFLLFYISYVW